MFNFTQVLVMPTFRVIAGLEGLYFAWRDAVVSAGGHELLSHLMHPGFLLLCAYVLIESAQFNQLYAAGSQVAAVNPSGDLEQKGEPPGHIDTKEEANPGRATAQSPSSAPRPGASKKKIGAGTRTSRGQR